MDQQIRFCRMRDGVTLAYARSGVGPPFVKAANRLSHLERDWDSPIWRPLLERLGERLRGFLGGELEGTGGSGEFYRRLPTGLRG